MYGIIKINKHTENHFERLVDKGYKARIIDNNIVVKCNGFYNPENIVDATSLKKLLEFFKQVITEKKLVPYSTRFRFEDGKILSAPFNLHRLGELSTFVAKHASVFDSIPRLNDLE